MSNATGTAVIDFGAWPGSTQASVSVTGQTNILATSKVSAFLMADDTTSDHTAEDHRFIGVLLTLTCGTPTAGTGFTIYANSLHDLTGTYSVRWVWAD